MKPKKLHQEIRRFMYSLIPEYKFFKRLVLIFNKKSIAHKIAVFRTCIKSYLILLQLCGGKAFYKMCISSFCGKLFTNIFYSNISVTLQIREFYFYYLLESLFNIYKKYYFYVIFS